MKNPASTFRAYYYFLLGMLGGLTGWFVMALTFRGADDLGLLTRASRGFILGGLIGLSIAAYDGLISRSLRRFFRLGLNGLLLGVGAGVIALPLAQWVFGQLWPEGQAGAVGVFSARTFLVGVFCWMILGGTIGFVEVIGKGTQSYKGLLGGVFGGIIGGGVYEVARTYGANVSPSKTQIMQAFCLALMGGFIGLSVALIPTLLRRAWVVVVDGKFAGYEYDVTKYVSKETGSRGAQGMIGSDELRANIYLPADKEVLSQHAVLCYTNEAPTLVVTPEAQKMNAKTLVNNYPVLNCPLSDGDKIQIGTTNLLYHQVRKGRKK
jgi:hypothetical protein